MYGTKLTSRLSSKRAALAGAATLVGLGLIAGGGYSAWDATVDAPTSGTVTAATVSLNAAENASESEKWTADLPNALPGASKTGYLDVSNTGTADLDVLGHLKADDASTGLEGALTVQVIKSTTPFDDQGHTQDDETEVHAAGAVDKTTGADTDLGKVAPGATVYLKIVTALPSDADVSNQSKTAMYDFGFVGTTA